MGLVQACRPTTREEPGEAASLSLRTGIPLNFQSSSLSSVKGPNCQIQARPLLHARVCLAGLNRLGTPLHRGARVPVKEERSEEGRVNGGADRGHPRGQEAALQNLQTGNAVPIELHCAGQGPGVGWGEKAQDETGEVTNQACMISNSVLNCPG